MKLYATVTSERASKRQGGNDKIEIQLKDENGQQVCLLYFFEAGLGYELKLIDDDENGMIYSDFSEERTEIKGKKQKGKYIPTFDRKAIINLHNCMQHAFCEKCGLKV